MYVNDFPRAQKSIWFLVLPHLAPRTVYFNEGNMTLNSNPNSIITRGLRSHPSQLWHNKIWAGLKPGQGVRSVCFGRRSENLERLARCGNVWSEMGVRLSPQWRNETMQTQRLEDLWITDLTVMLGRSDGCSWTRSSPCCATGSKHATITVRLHHGFIKFI